MDLKAFASAVGADGPVTIAGLATRGGAVAGARAVAAPAGIDWIQADEMTVCCGAGTHVDELSAALDAVGQRVALPLGGTVGGALAVGRSGLGALGHGPVRDTLLQARYIDAAGREVKAGGPTVKNVSGFDVCRLLVGSFGTLGFLGEVILRTRPHPRHSQWFTSDADPFGLFACLYRPTSVLWDGVTTWVHLEGHVDDVTAEAAACGLAVADGPPTVPTGGRCSFPPAAMAKLADRPVGSFLAEIGIGVVHLDSDAPIVVPDPVVAELNRRIKANFDPRARLNPGRLVINER